MYLTLERDDLRVNLVSVGLVSVVAADGGIPRLARGGPAEQAQQLCITALLKQGR